MDAPKIKINELTRAEQIELLEILMVRFNSYSFQGIINYVKNHLRIYGHFHLLEGYEFYSYVKTDSPDLIGLSSTEYNTYSSNTLGWILKATWIKKLKEY